MGPRKLNGGSFVLWLAAKFGRGAVWSQGNSRSEAWRWKVPILENLNKVWANVLTTKPFTSFPRAASHPKPIRWNPIEPLDIQENKEIGLKQETPRLEAYSEAPCQGNSPWQGPTPPSWLRPWMLATTTCRPGAPQTQHQHCFLINCSRRWLLKVRARSEVLTKKYVKQHQHAR